MADIHLLLIDRSEQALSRQPETAASPSVSRARKSASVRGFSLVAIALMGILWTPKPAAALYTIVYDGTLTQVASGLTNPSGLALDLAGNVYIADTGNNQILKVTAGGTPSPLSFTGVTSLNSPHQIVVDSAGNLYIADTGNNRIVKANPAGAATLVPLGGFTLNSPQGVAIDGLGNVFIADSGNNRVIEVTSSGSTLLSTALNSPVSSASFSNPVSLATDTYNNLYVVDQGNNRVVQITAAPGLEGNTVSTYQSLDSPVAVAVATNGVIYIVDGSSQVRVAIHDPQGDLYDLFDDDNTAYFGTPTAIAIDSRGAFYLTNMANGTTGSGVVNLFHQGSADFGHVSLGSSGAPLTLKFQINGLSNVTGVAIYTAGTPNLDFTIAANSGTPCVTGSNDVACTVNVQFTPTAAGLRRGALVLSYTNDYLGTGNFTVPLFGIGDGAVPAFSSGLASSVSTGSLAFPATFQPFQTASDGAGNIYATDSANSRILKIPAGGGSATVVNVAALPSTGGRPDLAGLLNPTGIAIDGAGNLFVADAGTSELPHDRIVEITPGGASEVINIIGAFSGFSNPQSLFVTGAGDLVIDDAGNNRIVDLTVAYSATDDNTLDIVGAFVMSTGNYSLSTGTNTNSPYNFATSAALDANGGLYVSDDVNNRIIAIDRFGTSSVVDFSTLSSALTTPHSVTFDPMGNFYVMDAGGNAGSQRVIQKFTDGTVSAMSFIGAGLGSSPNEFAVDGSGNLLVANYSPTASSNSLLQINVGRSALSFEPQQQNSTSAPQTVAVKNLGDLPLLFPANPIYTANFSRNTGDMDACTTSTSLSDGASCDVSVVFTPQATGSLSASITVTDNALNINNSTQLIAVSGTGTAAPSAVAPVYNPPSTSMSLTSSASSVAVGQTVTITAVLTAIGNLAGATPPTGTVQFFDGSNALGSVALTGGDAVFTTSTLSAGAHRITAEYSGDTTFSSIEASLVVTVTAPTIPTITLQNAAGSAPTNFAANEIVSLYGITGLTGDTTATPPTTSLGGVTVTITDSAGTARQALLFGVYASLKQINLLIPSGTATGAATVSIALPGGGTTSATMNIAGAAAGIFTASTNGQGVFAGQVIYAQNDGSQTVASPADPLSLAGGNQVFLVLYATGLRGASSVTAAANGVTVPVAYFGPQGGNNGYGLDQINLGPLPASLTDTGTVQLVITVNGQAANTVTFSVQ